MQGPLEHWLGAETLAKKVAEDVEGLVTRKAALQEEAEKALEAATTRTERQSAKAASFQKREEFFTQAIALLDTHIEGDRVIITSLEGDGTPEVEKAHKEVQTLIKDVAAMRQHIAAKGLSFAKDPSSSTRRRCGSGASWKPTPCASRRPSPRPSACFRSTRLCRRS
jgi:hypothetical protein